MFNKGVQMCFSINKYLIYKHEKRIANVSPNITCDLFSVNSITVPHNKKSAM
jgi:hypothetical protein